MPNSSTTITLQSLATLLRRQSWVVALVVAVAVGASVALSASMETKYTAEAAVAFNNDGAELQALGIPASPSFQPEKEVAAQAERITRADVAAEVRRALNLELTVAEIQDAVVTRLEATSNLVTIVAEGPTGFLAAQIANGFARSVKESTTAESVERYEAAAREARRRASRLRGPSNAARRAVFEDQAARLLGVATFARPVEIVRAAEVPSTPSSPKPVRNAVLAALLGLMLGLALAFTRHAFDRRLRDLADVVGRFDEPVIGHLRTSALGRTPLSADDATRTSDEDVEAFRILRPAITFLATDAASKVVLVTSALPEEGKSTVAVGLAWSEALTGRRTLLVDCDLRRPTIADRLGLERAPGLADFLAGDATPADILRTVALRDVSRDDAHLVVIPAGRPVTDHAELLESAKFTAFIQEVAKVYDRVILDSAPVLPVGDTLHLLPHADVITLCVRLNQSSHDGVAAALETLDRVPDTPRALVVTAADKGGTGYYSGYGYEAQEATARA